MTASITLTIAGIPVRISAPDDLVQVLPPEISAYEYFLGLKSAHDPAIEVIVSTDPVPRFLLEGRNKLFDGGGVWSLYRHNDDYLLTHNPFADQPPLWVIHCTRNFTWLNGYCSKRLIREIDGGKTTPCPISYPLDQIILLHHLARRQGLLVHCAGVEYDGRISILPGVSGAGKSTVSNLLKGSAGITLLSDDRLVLRRENDQLLAYGTPWPGDAGIAENRQAPLANIYFLKQAGSNMIVELSPAEALNRLLPVASIPWYDKDVLPDVLDFCGELVGSVPAFELHFTLDKKLGRFLTDECRL